MGKESDLGYHKLVRDFLRGLCQRMQTDAAHATPAAPAPAPAPAAPAPAPAQTGGAAPTPTPTPAPRDPALYCATADHFTAYLTQPPQIALRDSRPRQGRPAAVNFMLSKVSTVTVTLIRGGALAFLRTMQLGHGYHSFGWGRPQKAGPYAVRVRAVDLAGNAGVASGVLHVRPKG
jgi:hypothetical protein